MVVDKMDIISKKNRQDYKKVNKKLKYRYSKIYKKKILLIIINLFL